MEYGERRRSFGGNRGGGRGGGYGGGGGGYGGGGGFRGGAPQAPVKEGEELNVEIVGVAGKGDGVAKKNGFVIFVPGTKVGDKAKIRITKVAKKVSFAEVVGPYEGPDTTESQSSSNDAPQEAAEEPAAEPEEQYDASQDSEEF